ncbi:MAG TPA: 23S rRNA (guanosine(2251)-2'-O)-methyltransferase RlmB [Nitrospiraceae bacterium]|jgi:23S rRNA (guanosine2251-2'-O)-methyltransferase|nr:23S rRNA (guanosine(2251)-2'-O)-methyltransferase RlmB [Nitrospiraceae bacterium]
MRSKFSARKKFLESAHSTEWVYGINPVLEAFRAKRDIKVVYVAAGRQEKVLQITREAAIKGIPVQSPDSDFFDKTFPKGHQGVAAKVLQKSYMSLDDLLIIPAGKNETPLFVVLDCIEDPRNLGAILRSVDASGAHGVVIQAYRSASLGPEVSKASAGAVEYVPVAVVANVKHALRRMKQEGISVIGAEADAPKSLWEMDLTVPLCIVIGSEGKGMRKTVMEHCDSVANLPMRGKINSLNVSVATGIILFEALRQRFAKKALV